MEKAGVPVTDRASSHNLAFAAVAATGFQPQNILELGTNTGQTARYLAELFPMATVYTVELPADDPLYKHFNKAPATAPESVSKYLDSPRIRALRVNTAYLSKEHLPSFDLIWLDAGHTYPSIAWDHFFCLGVLRAGGWLFSDDLTLPDNWRVRAQPRLLHVYEVIKYYNERQPTRFEYFIKREDPVSFSLNPKYIAYLRMPAADPSAARVSAAPLR
jgi:predicted O-methyltransferase YrrM